MVKNQKHRSRCICGCEINIVFDLLATIFILLAAFIISSKYVAKPKIRIACFSSYMLACVFFILYAITVSSFWLFIQQLVLICINARGLYYAIKVLKGEK